MLYKLKLYSNEARILLYVSLTDSELKTSSSVWHFGCCAESRDLFTIKLELFN